MKLTNLNFHQTFPPSGAMLSRLLTSDVFGESLTKEEISQRTGIPTGKSSGKVEPHIAYAVYMGLVKDEAKEGKHTLNLTTLGETVVNEDPGLCEIVTRMVCHLRLTSPYGGASLWTTVVGEIMSEYPRGLSAETLLSVLKKESTVNVNMGPLFSSYEEEFFAPLDLLERQGDMVFLKKHKTNEELIFVYAYSLFREWEVRFPGQDELVADDLDLLFMPKTVGWKQTEFYDAMEIMQDKGLLTFNRQLMPFTVTKHFAADMLISRLYSELF